jgi:uncharacterized protein YutE (UPF0331/DUF86 family)
MEKQSIKDRIEDKILQINKFLEELYEIVPYDFEEYKRDFKSRAACERYFEKIVEGVIDIAFLLIRYKKFRFPEDDEGIFKILFEREILSENLAEKLKEAKGMRNVIVHEYGEVDDALVFESIANELKEDTENFLNQINTFLNHNNLKSS